ncbi:hypothetical protein DW083_06150 [Parabacteroides sp. AF48-14]|uniref:hypothetical protein n=1 Tax=Parabacteroides sp. AF48-14 TaxID=2292052 RepID=UPI000FF13C30|nr:hypothetical protein [Parabacteroides sp. AF48-14]RHO73426.1 hypothetical protein DW083_06150 [Parabacteroides sp. AF48-14]
MKKILPLIVVIVLLMSCNRVEPIQSLSQLEPALRKHVGNPSKIDTAYKGDILPFSGIRYEYDSVPEVKFEDLVEFLSKAYNTKPVITEDFPRRRAEFIPLKDHSGAYRIQVNDYWDGDVKERQLGFAIIDVNNELIPPSSQTPQTSVPSK